MLISFLLYTFIFASSSKILVTTARFQRTCPPDAFQCADGRCIPNEWVCDGMLDCVGKGLGWDETATVCDHRKASHSIEYVDHALPPSHSPGFDNSNDVEEEKENIINDGDQPSQPALPKTGDTIDVLDAQANQQDPIGHAPPAQVMPEERFAAGGSHGDILPPQHSVKKSAPALQQEVVRRNGGAFNPPPPLPQSRQEPPFPPSPPNNPPRPRHHFRDPQQQQSGFGNASDFNDSSSSIERNVLPTGTVDDKTGCPTQMILHKICSKTLDSVLNGISESAEQEFQQNKSKNEINRGQPRNQHHLDFMGPMSLQQMIRGCLSYASYNGCVVALAPQRHCLPPHGISQWLNSTYRLFCNAQTLTNVTQHNECLDRVRLEPKVLTCQHQYLSSDNLLPNPDFEICPVLINFIKFAHCVQDTVKRRCDNGASELFDNIQQNIMNEMLRSECQDDMHKSAEADRKRSTKGKPSKKRKTISFSVDQNADKMITEDNRLQGNILPFMESKRPSKKHKPIKVKLSSNVSTNDEGTKENLGGSRKTTRREDKRLFPACSTEQEEKGKECFRWVSALPHTGTNLPPNQWLLEMAAKKSDIMQDTCHALKIYERCLEETVFRADGRCGFKSWIPLHVDIAKAVLCDEEVVKTMRANQPCLLRANKTEEMDRCADKDEIIVSKIRETYQNPGRDSTCHILAVLGETYECIGDVTLPYCGRDILFALGKLRMNLMRISVEEGCSGCTPR